MGPNLIKKTFTGYKANSMKSEDGFVTNIITTPGNTYDGDILLPLVDEKAANSSKPKKVAGDTHHGSAENRYQNSFWTKRGYPALRAIGR